MRLTTLGAVLVAFGALHATAAAQDPAQQEHRPTFRGRVDLVAISAVVRQANGKPVLNLTQDDFELYDNGVRRPISQFESADTPVSVGLLVDLSGSMEVAYKLGQARETASQLLSWLRPGVDQVGLFSFETRVREIQGMTPAPGDILRGIEAIRPFGATSIYDAVADTGERVAAEAGSRRAIVALTDGSDNHSQLTAPQVSGIASSIDVPVYIIVVVSPLDRFENTVVDERALDATLHGPLADLAHWTGGEIFAGTNPAATSQAARQVVTELRHAYLIAFEPGTESGWHAIDVRTKKKNLTVRARSGYVVKPRPAFLR